MHSLSKTLTGAAVATIPCETDLRQMRMEIDATRIDDPVLEKVAGFSQGSLKHCGAHSIPDGMEVMDRTMTITDLQRVGGCQSGRQVVFGLTHGSRNVHERQQCGNGG